MNSVRVLPRVVADQIAAGEVVERPASIVKELVENSIDAGAGRIEVNIDHGGASRITVTDDGSGMSPEDAVLALESHATSKISSIEDLHELGTFGFRGEALPSIASVSRMTLLSRRHEDSTGTRIRVEGGEIIEKSEAGAPAGTRIDVADVFFNVPARRKFLKSENVEAGHCMDAIKRLSLANHHTTFLAGKNGRVTRQLWSAEDLAERVEQNFASMNLKMVHDVCSEISVAGFLAPPAKARSGAANVLTFVNRRFVRDKGLIRSVWQSYSGMLDPGRYATAVVFIDMDPAVVDFNVHPQKLEVRFSDPGRVYSAVTRVLTGFVSTSPWQAPGIEASAFEYEQPVTDPSGIAEGVSSYLRAQQSSMPDHGISRESWPSRPRPVDMTTTQRSMDSGSVHEQSGTEQKADPVRYIGQARERYLIFEDEDGIIIMDQHAAHERILFGRVKEGWKSRNLPSQALIEPVTVELPESLEALAAEKADDLALLGLGVASFGPGTVVINSIPAVLSGVSPEKLFFDALGSFEGAKGKSVEDQIDDVIATMVCHGSIRSGQELSRQEAQAIFMQLEETPYAGFCPHGRSVTTRISFSEIDRMVGRG